MKDKEVLQNCNDELNLLSKYMEEYITTRVNDWKDYFYIKHLGIMPIRSGVMRLSFKDWKQKFIEE